MQKLSITKADFLGLAAILASRHPQNEVLVVEEMPICWKIFTTHPITAEEKLIAYIHKNQHHENPVLAAYSKLHRNMVMDSAEIPTIARYDHNLHAVKRTNSRPGTQDY